jgi:hypothetical protein
VRQGKQNRTSVTKYMVRSVHEVARLYSTNIFMRYNILTAEVLNHILCLESYRVKKTTMKTSLKCKGFKNTSVIFGGKNNYK